MAVMRGLLFVLLMGGVLGACAVPAPSEPLVAATPAVDTPAPSGSIGEVDYSCRTDADCAVKDVGNCCGYYPACVNSNSPTFAEQVRAECAREGTSGVCGFPVIDSCQCVASRCEAAPGDAAALPLD